MLAFLLIKSRSKTGLSERLCGQVWEWFGQQCVTDGGRCFSFHELYTRPEQSEGLSNHFHHDFLKAVGNQKMSTQSRQESQTRKNILGMPNEVQMYTEKTNIFNKLRVRVSYMFKRQCIRKMIHKSWG